MSYKLCNPYIEGRELTSEKTSVNDAAEQIWSEMSLNIKNYIPKFYFSIQNNKNNKLFHYKVKESMENGQVSYVISQIKKIKKL
jgi:hypothetical protein